MFAPDTEDTLIGPELQTPLGPPVGQDIVTAVAPCLSVRAALPLAHVPRLVPPVLVNVTFEQSCSLIVLDEAKKFESNALGVLGQAVQLLPEVVHG
jgi:hypothetical protein